MSSWLGIDHGHKRIGVAVGSEADGVALPVGVLSEEQESQILSKIGELAREYNATGIVVGLPLNMDDSVGPQAIIAKEFAIKLSEVVSLDIRMWDERLSSFQADSDLAGHLTRKKRRARQDAIAAASFLSDFLANNGPARALRPDQICQ